MEWVNNLEMNDLEPHIRPQQSSKIHINSHNENGFGSHYFSTDIKSLVLNECGSH